MSFFEDTLYRFFHSDRTLRNGDIDEVKYLLIGTGGSVLSSVTRSGISGFNATEPDRTTDLLAGGGEVDFGQINSDFDRVDVRIPSGATHDLAGNRLLQFSFPTESPDGAAVKMDTCEFALGSGTPGAFYMLIEAPDSSSSTTVPVTTEITSGGSATGETSSAQDFDVDYWNQQLSNQTDIEVTNSSGATIDPADGSLTKAQSNSLGGASQLSKGGLDGESFTWPDGATIIIDTLTVTWNLS